MSRVYIVVEHNLASGRSRVHGTHTLWNAALIDVVEKKKDAEYTSNDCSRFQILACDPVGEVDIVYSEYINLESMSGDSGRDVSEGEDE